MFVIMTVMICVRIDISIIFPKTGRLAKERFETEINASRIRGTPRLKIPSRQHDSRILGG